MAAASQSAVTLRLLLAREIRHPDEESNCHDNKDPESKRFGNCHLLT